MFLVYVGCPYAFLVVENAMGAVRLLCITLDLLFETQVTGLQMTQQYINFP